MKITALLLLGLPACAALSLTLHEVRASGCDDAEKTVARFLALEGDGKTLDSSAEWRDLLYWKDRDGGTDVYVVTDHTRIVSCTDSRDGQEAIKVVTIESDLLGEIGMGGHNGDHPKLTRPISRHETRGFRLYQDGGIWKIDAGMTDPPHVSLATVRKMLTAANCSARPDAAVCAADIAAIRERLDAN